MTLSPTTRTIPPKGLRFEADLAPLPTETAPAPAPAPATEPAPAPEQPDPEQPTTTSGIPFRITARTGAAVKHWYWGDPTIHDFAGMRAPSKLPVDYCHNPADIVGFADGIDTASGSLVLTGKLTPFSDDDRASELKAKWDQGVPYQASILMGDDGLSVEEVGEGATALVNGQTVTGPVTIFRSWSLRGVAICPQGVDPESSVEFSAKAAPATAKVYRFSAPAPAAPTTEPAKTGKDFLAAFGPQGGTYFAEGMTWSQAEQRHREQLAAENSSLRATVERLRGGQPVEFQAEPPPGAPPRKQTPPPARNLAYGYPKGITALIQHNAAALGANG